MVPSRRHSPRRRAVRADLAQCAASASSSASSSPSSAAASGSGGAARAGRPCAPRCAGCWRRGDRRSAGWRRPASASNAATASVRASSADEVVVLARRRRTPAASTSWRAPSARSCTTQAFDDEVRTRRSDARCRSAGVPAAASEPRAARRCSRSPFSRMIRITPERRAAQRIGIARAGRLLADREEAGELIELVGQRDGDRHRRGGHGLGRARAARSGRGWRRRPRAVSPSCSA